MNRCYSPAEVEVILKFLADILAGARPCYLWSYLPLDNYTFPLELCHAIAASDALCHLHPLLAERTETPTDVLEMLARRYLEGRPGEGMAVDVARALATNPTTPVALLERLASESELLPHLANQLVTHPALPVEYLPCLASHVGSPHSLASALRREEVTPELVRRVWQASRRDVVSVRAMLACPIAPPDVLEEIHQLIPRVLRTHDVVDARASLARHPNAPPAVLAQLAFDRQLSVRLAALCHPNLPAETARRAQALSRRSGHVSSIRTALASNPSCPPDVLLDLVLDQNPTVVTAARRNLAECRVAQTEQEVDACAVAV